LHYLFGGVCLIQGLGRFDEGWSLLDRRSDLLAEEAWALNME
jgi:hypothetical protein